MGDVVSMQDKQRQMLIEQGWQDLRKAMLPTATPVQIEEARRVFFAGAMHLWVILMEMLADGKRPDKYKDKKLRDIQLELEGFLENMAAEESAERGGKLDG